LKGLPLKRTSNAKHAKWFLLYDGAGEYDENIAIPTPTTRVGNSGRHHDCNELMARKKLLSRNQVSALRKFLGSAQDFIDYGNRAY
jgi:hypothetical protein